MLVAACCAGLVFICVALTDPELEWRLLALVALAFALSPVSAELRSRSKPASITIPFVHSVMFAGAIALGPACAALPGAFAGTAKLFFDPTERRPVSQVLYAVLKPAAVCSGAAFVYVAMGGDAALPHRTDSFVPMLLAAAAYVSLSAVFVGLADCAHPSSGTERPRGSVLAVSWALCLAAGYPLAVVYAFAPGWVLLVPAAAAALAHAAFKDAPAEIEERESADLCPTDSSEGEFVDPATGLANRRYLMMFVSREISRAQRSRRPISLAIFDLDESKSLLERHGPESLDDLLALMANCMRSGLRDYDLVARYSNGRLIVALPEAPSETAFEIAGRLHESAASVEIDGKPLEITVGIATFPEHASTAEELVNSAHHALNRGRFTGANRVHSLHELRKAS